MTLRAALLAHRGAVPAACVPRRGNGRIAVLGLFGVAVGLQIFGMIVLDVSPARIVHGLWRLWDVIGLMVPPSPGSWERFSIYLAALGQTLSIAFLGTLLAALLGGPLGFLAAKNILPNPVLHFLARRSLDTIRSVDTLIWALIWINVVGLGPFAGTLAVASTDLAAFGKLVSEAIETADRKPVEGITSTGGSWLAAIRFGIVPQVLPVFASQVLYFFESNTRSATIIGIVGAGGIGQHLSEMIMVLEWQQVAFLILMILVAVAGIDVVSRRLRGAILGRKT